MEISVIGSSDTTALLCHTNRPASGAISGGNWLALDGTRVGGPCSHDVARLDRNRGPMVVRLGGGVTVVLQCRGYIIA